MYVHHAYQGQGIASLICEALVREAMRLGHSRIYTDASITARSFFEAKGFLLVSTTRTRRKGLEITNYRMDKSLR